MNNARPQLFGMLAGLFLAAGLAGLHDADMGVFQIVPLHSGDTSGGGINDTSSLEKTITAVVAATFALK